MNDSFTELQFYDVRKTSVLTPTVNVILQKIKSTLDDQISEESI